MRCCCAVIGINKPADKRIAVKIRVPEEFGDIILFKFGQIRPGVAASLLEHHRNAVLPEKLYVRLNGMEIRERTQVCPELHHVIPHENVIRKPAPV